MNLKIMKLVPGFRYSSVAAPNSTENDLGERLTVDGTQQIPRRPAGVKLRRGVTYGAGLRLELHTPAVASASTGGVPAGRGVRRCTTEDGPP